MTINGTSKSRKPLAKGSAKSSLLAVLNAFAANVGTVTGDLPFRTASAIADGLSNPGSTNFKSTSAELLNVTNPTRILSCEIVSAMLSIMSATNPRVFTWLLQASETTGFETSSKNNRSARLLWQVVVVVVAEVLVIEVAVVVVVDNVVVVTVVVVVVVQSESKT